MARKKHPVQIGTLCKVIEPMRFIRCGYELTVKNSITHLTEEKETEIIDFLVNMGYPESLVTTFGYDKDKSGKKIPNTYRKRLFTEHRAVGKFMQGLGFLHVRANSFGGKSRKVFSEYEEALSGNAIVRVVDIKHVMTGEYYPPSGDYDWYEPGGLYDQTQHRIAKVYVSKREGGLMIVNDHPEQDGYGLWIEARHLEVIPEEVDA